MRDTYRQENCPGNGELIRALEEATTRISTRLTPDHVLEALGAALDELGLYCLVGLVDRDSQTLIVRYTSLTSSVLARVEEAVGFTLVGLRIPLDSGPANQLLDLSHVLFGADLVSLVTALLHGIPAQRIERGARLAGVTTSTLAAFLPLTIEGRTIGALCVWGKDLSEQDIPALLIFAGQVAIALENTRLHAAGLERTDAMARVSARLTWELQERQRMDEALRQRNRELALLNRIARTFTATLDLDQLLGTILEEVRQLLGVNSSSIWLTQPDTGELVCRLATGPRSELVRGWRLAMGEGLVGWAALKGESLIVSDAKADTRHVEDVDQETGISLRSVLSVPLKITQKTVGVIQVLDTGVDRFQPSDQALVEAIASAAAIAIDNARLYQETDRLRAFNENIVQSMEEGVLLEDGAGYITFVNPKAAELLGYPPGDLIGQHWQLTVGPEYARTVSEQSARRPEGVSGRYEAALLTRQGQVVPVIVSARPLFKDGEFQGVLSVFTDITNRKRAEEELRESEEKYRDLVENINEVIYALDRDGVITYVSPVVETLLGYRPEEVIGQPFSVFIHPEDLRRTMSSVAGILDGSPAANEYRLVTKSGDVCWVRTSSRPVFDDHGVTGIRGVLSDITEHKRTEQERHQLEEKLERARRMESLGILAGGIAHDLNNILGPIVAYPDLIVDALPQDSPVRGDILEIQRSAQKAAVVVQDMLALARRGIYRMVPLSLNAIVDEYVRSVAFAELCDRYPRVSVEVDLDPDLLNTMGSAPHLSKTLMNLVTNAFEAIPDQGQVTIQTYCESLDRPTIGYEYIGTGDYIVLRVADTGTGIEPDDLGRIFEPFFTKKKLGQSGSGLGLAVVHGVVHDHHGNIDVQTQVGIGTAFTVYFPVTRSDLPEPSQTEGDYRGTESILVVDDLVDQRELAIRLLSSLGYRVKSVDSGRAAIDYLSESSADILVLDMIMDDGLDGLDTYREIARTHPGQRAVIASGFAQTERVKEAQGLGAGQFVKKPYTLAGLGKAVRQELDRSQPRQAFANEHEVEAASTNSMTAPD